LREKERKKGRKKERKQSENDVKTKTKLLHSKLQVFTKVKMPVQRTHVTCLRRFHHQLLAPVVYYAAVYNLDTSRCQQTFTIP